MIHDDMTSEAGTTAGVGFVLGGSFELPRIRNPTLVFIQGVLCYTGKSTSRLFARTGPVP